MNKIIKVARDCEWYTVDGYLKAKGINLCVKCRWRIEEAAVEICRELGHVVGLIPDPDYGEVHIFHEDILGLAVDEVLGGISAEDE